MHLDINNWQIKPRNLSTSLQSLLEQCLNWFACFRFCQSYMYQCLNFANALCTHTKCQCRCTIAILSVANPSVKQKLSASLSMFTGTRSLVRWVHLWAEISFVQKFHVHLRKLTAQATASTLLQDFCYLRSECIGLSDQTDTLPAELQDIITYTKSDCSKQEVYNPATFVHYILCIEIP